MGFMDKLNVVHTLISQGPAFVEKLIAGATSQGRTLMAMFHTDEAFLKEAYDAVVAANNANPPATPNG